MRGGGLLALGAEALVVAPAAAGRRLRREHLVVAGRGQRRAHPLIGLGALLGDLLGPPQVPRQALVGVRPGEHLAARQMMQLHLPAVAVQRARGGDRVQGKRERTARVVHREHVAARLVVDDDELGPVRAVRARPCVETVDPPGDRDHVGARRHRPLHADRLVRRVEAGDVAFHQAARPVPVPGRLRVAREPLVDPARRDERAGRRHRAPRQRQPPPARERVVHARADAVVRPRRPLGRGRPIQVAHPVAARAVQPGRQPGRRARVEPPRHALEAELLHNTVRYGRPGRHPAVEALRGVADRRLLAVARQHPGRRREVEQPLADRGELPGEVGVLPLVRDGPDRRQGVPGEHDLEVLAVQADRAGRVTRRVDDLERHVGDVEPAAGRHLDLRVDIVVRHPPEQQVRPVQRHRRLVPLRHLDRGGHVAGVPVRADHGEDLAVADRLEHRVRVLARVDHDHLVIVPDQPGVAFRTDRLRRLPRHLRRRHPLDPSLHDRTSAQKRPTRAPTLCALGHSSTRITWLGRRRRGRTRRPAARRSRTAAGRRSW